MTTRDYEIIDFVKKFSVVSTSTIQQEFFPSLSACQKRLKIIYDNRCLKRTRDFVSSEYIYFVKSPKQLRHKLLISSFYRELSRIANVPVFNIEPLYGNIRPDAAFGYEFNGHKFLGLLEVEISNKGFDFFKYNKFYLAGNYKEFFPVMPELFIVSDKLKIPILPYKAIRVSTNLLDLPFRLGIR